MPHSPTTNEWSHHSRRSTDFARHRYGLLRVSTDASAGDRCRMLREPVVMPSHTASVVRMLGGMTRVREVEGWLHARVHSWSGATIVLRVDESATLVELAVAGQAV